MKDHKIALLISGTGTNAMRIIQYQALASICEFLVISTKENTAMQGFCSANYIEYREIYGKSDEINNEIQEICKSREVSHIVLAGFLKQINPSLISMFKGRIINLHPSLLPKFGGKGMFGRHVHQAVFDAKQIETGITIHEVSEEYDKGTIIAQFKISLSPDDTVDKIEEKIKVLEQKYFPDVVIKFITE
jgi:phosphoribosylglycinamide formyltransferase-1